MICRVANGISLGVICAMPLRNIVAQAEMDLFALGCSSTDAEHGTGRRGAAEAGLRMRDSVPQRPGLNSRYEKRSLSPYRAYNVRLRVSTYLVHITSASPSYSPGCSVSKTRSI